MTFLRSTPSRPFNAPVRRSLVLAAATWSALLLAGCSVDSKGFGGFDAGLGGTGTGATSATGGMSVTGSGGVTGGGGVNGSGGVAATGGMPMSGSGGAHASGGTPGTGGHEGTGGAAGGHVGSGGIGEGGRVGSGGAAGGAGHEGSGSGGKMGMGGGGGKGGLGGGGGPGGHGGETCDQLVMDYTSAMAEARACTVGATGQCQQLAPGTLSYCTGCGEVSVNDDTHLTAIRAQWTAAGCNTPTVCPAIACVVPITGTCVVSDSAAGGLCQSGGIAGTGASPLK